MDVAGGRVFFTDVSNHRVRAVDLAAGTISTVVGRGPGDPGSADLGDGGPASAAVLSTHPMRVMARGADLYISDAHQNRIRRVDGATGIISTLAGTGAPTCAGDGGPAAAAAVHSPHAVRADAAGHLYIADTANARIRRVDAVTGVITTVAGTGRKGFSGDGGPATAADLAAPQSVAVDADGTLYIVDPDAGRIRRVDAATGTITTVAGTGAIAPLVDGVAPLAACFGRLRDAVVAADGSLLVCDGGNSVVCRIDLQAARVRIVAGTGAAGFAGDGGPARAALLNQPYSIALDAAGTVIIKDSCNRRIRRVDGDGMITTIAGNGEYGFAGDGGSALAARLAIGR